MLEFALFRQIVLLRQAWLFGIGLLCFGAVGLVRGTQSSNDCSIELPLHQRIDELVENDAIGPLASLCSDADFLRRVTLDLAGTIPTVEQVNTFLDDRSLKNICLGDEINSLLHRMCKRLSRGRFLSVTPGLNFIGATRVATTSSQYMPRKGPLFFNSNLACAQCLPKF